MFQRAFLLSLFLVSPLAVAAEDRDDTTPTGWLWYHNQSASDINNLKGQGWRLVDLQVENASGTHTYTTAWVANSGAYQKTWTWGYDYTPSQALTIAQSGYRAIVFRAYELSPGDLRVAVVWIENTGPDYKVWWFYLDQTRSSIASACTANNARPTQISSYLTSGQLRYAVIMISNTGTDGRSYAFYADDDLSTVQFGASHTGYRLTDLDYEPGTNRYAGVLEFCDTSCPQWWWGVGLSDTQALAIAAQDAARIMDVTTYAGCGSRCADVLFIDDANPITDRIGKLLRDSIDGAGGTVGFYLKRVNGPVLGALESDYQFQPASTIKVCAHLYAMRQVDQGIAHLGDAIVRYDEPGNDPDTCPGNTVVGTEPLETALREMMWHSDNTRTREVMDTFGRSNIDAMMLSIGMTKSSMNQVIGCNDHPDYLTLHDAGLLYEGVATSTLLNSTNRAEMFALMAGRNEYEVEGHDFTGVWDGDFPYMIGEEAPPQMSSSNRNSLYAVMDTAYKAGGYDFCLNGGCTNHEYHVSIAGWAKLPFCSGMTITGHEYLWGGFVDGAVDHKPEVDATFGVAKREWLREQMHDSLASCLHGDANHDGTISVADVFYLINYLFAGGPAPLGWGDATNDGKVTVADVFYLVNYLFAGGPAPI